MKKIIVTGGLGFIGSNLIELLLKKNFYIINIDKGTYSSNLYNTKDFIKSKKYKYIKLDISNKKIEKIFAKYKPSGIFNLAAETHVDRSIDNPGNFIQSNIVGVYNLLECFKKFSKKNISRLIHISTDEVYGDVLNGRSDEKYPYQPSSPYAASKAASDHLVGSYIKTYNLPAIVTNCSNNYGPKQHPEKLIPKLIFNIINNRPLPIYGKGKNSREWIYVKDHCEALIKVFQKGRLGEFYNIGTGEKTTLKELANILLKLKKSKLKIIFEKNNNFLTVKNRIGSTLKAKREIKFNSKISLRKGLEQLIIWKNKK